MKLESRLRSSSLMWVFFPMTKELTAWYATDFTITLAICVPVVVYGQSLFGGKLLED
jgi:hypothetical protein